MSINKNIKSKDAIEFTCIPERCVYDSPDYKVYGARVDVTKYPQIKLNQYDNITISGSLHTLSTNVEYNVVAIPESNKYGVSYKVINIKRDKPEGENSTKAFLMEILTPLQSEVLFNVYPNIVDKVMKNDLADIDLNLLHGIKEFTFNKIKEKIIENFALIDIVSRFSNILNLSIIRKLYISYPSIEQIERKLQQDPYAALTALARIGFRSADSLILEMDRLSKEAKARGEKPVIDFDYDIKSSPQRSKACIMYLLEENENNGHTRLDVKELKSQCEKLAPACSHHFVSVIKDESDIYFDKSTLSVALTKTYTTEKYIATRILAGLENNTVWDIDYKKYMQDDNGITLTDEQGSALECLCKHNIMVLNGSAGCGKSATTTSIIKMLKDNRKSFLLFSPTARAAKVLSGYAKHPASTIHRGLGFRPPCNWTYNAMFNLDCDVLIIDESGMIDVFLFEKVLEAINFTKTKVLLIGDSSQLNSVGAGNCLHDILKSKLIPTIQLTKVFRYGKGGLMTVATQTRNSERFVDNEQTDMIMFGEDKSYIFIPTTQDKAIVKIKQLYAKLLKDGYTPKDILVLSSFNKGEYGTVELNRHLQPIANDIQTKLSYSYGETKFYRDDLVMQCVNDYEALIYDENADLFTEPQTMLIPNGEIGVVKSILKDGIVVDFDGVLIVRNNNNLQQLKLAYSIGIHKIQGSSCRLIILFTPKAHTYMLNSNLIYVGQTRAREKVYHFGEPQTVNRAIKKKADLDRKTFLKELLTNNKN